MVTMSRAKQLLKLLEQDAIPYSDAFGFKRYNSTQPQCITADFREVDKGVEASFNYLEHTLIKIFPDDFKAKQEVNSLSRMVPFDPAYAQAVGWIKVDKT